MREGLWRTKKGGPKQIPKKCKKITKNHKQSQNITKNHQSSKNVTKLNMGDGRGGAQRCATVRNGAQAVFPW